MSSDMKLPDINEEINEQQYQVEEVYNGPVAADGTEQAKLRKTNYSMTTGSHLNKSIYYVNENQVTSKSDEEDYETPIPTEQNSYEKVTACDTSTKQIKCIEYNFIYIQDPGVPNITSLSATASSIDIRWSPHIDGNPCEIIQYNVSIESCLMSLSKITIDTYLHVDTNIYASTPYRVKVAARTIKGYGNYSSSLLVETKEKSYKLATYIVAWVVSTAVHLMFTAYLIFIIRKLRKTNYSMTTGSHLNKSIYYVNENQVTSKSDEEDYETPIPTEQNSYEKVTACDTSTKQVLGDTYEDYEEIPPP
ncbi:uncharacterized protein LOC117124523 [Anneissia japonica]|uniref:uncharacterized protein LOC117124523 n=1 Tax=Anneissia japonica TaxID=1529436 RepID=UPI0014258F8D|nr:uncharacterized protein LOC117124523 [Anneissia japonica]